MSVKKTMLTVAAVTALTAATAVPAMALENEFHGMYRVYGYLTNAETGGTSFNLRDDAKNSFFGEQRARIMYIAKANDDLKLVTHFELDARFGGQTAGKYLTTDSGNLDADQVTLETKNFYLDFNVPSTPLNMKVGLQPFNDAYQGVFGAFDATGVAASAKFGALTPTIAWFRLGDNAYVSTGADAGTLPGDNTIDLFVGDVKFAVNKDLAVGGSYYVVTNDAQSGTVGFTTATTAAPAFDYEFLHQVGLNASAKVGPASLSGFAAYQFGDYSGDADISAWAAAAIAKVAVGPGKLNLSALYLTGEDDVVGGTTPSTRYRATGDMHAYRQLATNGSVSYFNPSNMWLLIRNGAMINSSTAIQSTDLTKGNVGLIGVFGGYEMVMGKAFVNANIGYARAEEKRGAESANIGTEVNATFGYKVYDNLTASVTGAYAFLMEGMTDTTSRLPGGAANADDPYLANIQLSYLF